MWNKPTLEDIEAMELPGIRNVTSKKYEHRRVYMHFFHDEEEYFVAGFNPESEEFFGYSVSYDSKLQPYGAWGRYGYEKIVSMKSSTGAEMTRNLNFESKRANDIPKIRIAEERMEED